MSDGNKKNYDSNYFWSIMVDSIDVFDCAYKVWFCCMLHDVTVDIFLEMLLLERKVFLNFLDTVKAAPHDCLISLL